MEPSQTEMEMNFENGKHDESQTFAEEEANFITDMNQEENSEEQDKALVEAQSDTFKLIYELRKGINVKVCAKLEEIFKQGTT